jgi:flavin-dependent dehydrogenase
MSNAVFVPDSFCAVAGINLAPQRAQRLTECRIGDALTMIPPLTGNGMSIAFESAELAIEPLAGWSRGEAAWSQVRETIAHKCDAALSRRLTWAKWLRERGDAFVLGLVLVLDLLVFDYEGEEDDENDTVTLVAVAPVVANPGNFTWRCLQVAVTTSSP